MKTSKKGLDLIKQFEGFKSEPYQCSAGVWTIGYGTTYYPKGQPVRENDPEISIAQAEIYLKSALAKFETSVERFITVDLTQNEFDALVSFTYNLGGAALQNSTLRKKLNARDYVGAAAEFKRWNKAGGKELAGLTRRRLAEEILFSSPECSDD